MQHAALHPLGVTVTGLSLRDLDSEAVAGLQHLLAHRGFVVFPGQDIDDQTFVAFLRLFGDLTFSRGEQPLAAFPDLNVVSNVGRITKPRSVFHVDTSYVSQPPAYTALRAVSIPGGGGETLFSDQYRAYETLPEALRGRLDGRTITHVVTGVDLGDDDEKSAEHPAFRTHPISGRTALFLSTPERCVAISGLPAAESRATIRFLYDHSTSSDNVYRHRWSAGDVVMWDNRCVMHRADHNDVNGDRVMHRGMVSAYGAESA